MSESLRNDGRIWVPKGKGDKRNPNEIPEEERDYYLERKYPSFGNLSPRDISSRSANRITSYNVCYTKLLRLKRVLSRSHGSDEPGFFLRPETQDQQIGPAESAVLRRNRIMGRLHGDRNNFV